MEDNCAYSGCTKKRALKRKGTGFSTYCGIHRDYYAAEVAKGREKKKVKNDNAISFSELTESKSQTVESGKQWAMRNGYDLCQKNDEYEDDEEYNTESIAHRLVQKRKQTLKDCFLAWRELAAKKKRLHVMKNAFDKLRLNAIIQKQAKSLSENQNTIEEQKIYCYLFRRNEKDADGRIRCKIGHSKVLDSRRRMTQTHQDSIVHVVGVHSGGIEKEIELQNMFEQYRTESQNEWFAFPQDLFKSVSDMFTPLNSNGEIDVKEEKQK
jgi:hypothetical protein